MIKDEIVERVRNCFLGIQIGDALGMPVETMTRKQILDATDGKGVMGFIAPLQRKIRETSTLKPGMTTDDWALNRAVIQSLTEARGFDHANMARWHVRYYDDCLWGPHAGDTKHATLAFDSWFKGDVKNGRHPEKPAPYRGPKTGLGNGVAMKIAPLALWHAIRQGRFETEPFLTDAIALGRMTHSHVDATVAGVAIGTIVGHLIHEPVRSYVDLDRCYRNTQDAVAGAAFRLLYVGASELALRLDRIASGSIDPVKIAEVTGTSCNALDSVPFSIAMFHLNACDIHQALIEAVNAGGDTDTIASMVGGMCGANLRSDSKIDIPVEWIDGLVDKGEEAGRLAERFVTAALS